MNPNGFNKVSDNRGLNPCPASPLPVKVRRGVYIFLILAAKPLKLKKDARTAPNFHRAGGAEVKYTFAEFIIPPASPAKRFYAHSYFFYRCAKKKSHS